MKLYRRVLFAGVFAIVGTSAAYARTDMSKVTCGAFLASGQANMAAAIMWLRGYHAGKRGVIDVIEQPPGDPTAVDLAIIARIIRTKVSSMLPSGSCRTSIAALDAG